jgi:hypothetical protein
VKSLFRAPSPQAGPTVLADFAELLALRNERHSASDRDIISALERLAEDDEDKLERPLADAFQELTLRGLHLGADAKDRYPFEVEGDIIRLREPYPKAERDFLYLFFLMATRLNMKMDRSYSGFDGAELFEYLSLEVAKRYWGGADDARVDGLVFGTARYNRDAKDADEVDIGKFSTAVNDLCDAMREGAEFRAKDPGPIKAKDAKVDLVVWRDFADQRAAKPIDNLRHRHGKLIGFGQCKTGSNWVDELEKTNPAKFCENWFHDQPLVKPIKLFFVCDRFVHPWHEKTRGLILFDRCRLVEYADHVSSELIWKCARWTKSVLEANKIKWW